MSRARCRRPRWTTTSRGWARSGWRCGRWMLRRGSVCSTKCAARSIATCRARICASMQRAGWSRHGRRLREAATGQRCQAYASSLTRDGYADDTAGISRDARSLRAGHGSALRCGVLAGHGTGAVCVRWPRRNG
ncbi:hypothetical protein BVI1335_430031 [Burkholderia vietnamiensis]|nr:hypothetical protein BVI1335_430031 [Burkholderia vietnamiensis]